MGISGNSKPLYHTTKSLGTSTEAPSAIGGHGALAAGSWLHHHRPGAMETAGPQLTQLLREEESQALTYQLQSWGFSWEPCPLPWTEPPGTEDLSRKARQTTNYRVKRNLDSTVPSSLGGRVTQPICSNCIASRVSSAF